MEERKQEILEDAIFHTCNKYFKSAREEGIEYINSALRNYMSLGDATWFTRAENARRNVVNNISREEMADFLADYAINASRTMGRKSSNEELNMFFQIWKWANNDTDKAKEEIKQCLLGKRDTFESYKASDFVQMVANLYVRDAVEKVYQGDAITQRVGEDVDPRFGLRNLKLNIDLYNLCREEILNGRQIKIQDWNKKWGFGRPERDYNLNDEMMAVTNIGRIRNNQEDSVLILYHPSNPKYKMLMVADGMGGNVAGEMASSEVAKEMIHWFESLPESMMLDSQKGNLRRSWQKKLDEINAKIVEKYPNAGTTFVGAIVGEKGTTIASIGDSRAYILRRDNQLVQVTEDDNIGFSIWKTKWDNYIKSLGRGLTDEEKTAMEKEKDSLRFQINSNVITNCLGTPGRAHPEFVDILNNRYRTLMLLSDGVTDCLSDSQLMAITKTTKPKDLARRIVDSALQTESRHDEDFRHRGVIHGGKDNTSAVVLDNRKPGSER